MSDEKCLNCDIAKMAGYLVRANGKTSKAFEAAILMLEKANSEQNTPRNKFVKLTEVGSANEIWLNVSKVKTFHRTPKGGTAIDLDNGPQLNVLESSEDVMMALVS